MTPKQLEGFTEWRAVTEGKASDCFLPKVGAKYDLISFDPGLWVFRFGDDAYAAHMFKIRFGGVCQGVTVVASGEFGETRWIGLQNGTEIWVHIADLIHCRKKEGKVGNDAVIYFSLNLGADIARVKHSLPVESGRVESLLRASSVPTHAVDVGSSYYAPGHEKGNWTLIAHVLMVLLAHPCVDSVWYEGDDYDDFEYGSPAGPPISAGLVLEYSAHYMRRVHGDG